GLEVATSDDGVCVFLIDVGAGDPAGSLRDAWVDEVADACGGFLAEHGAGGRPGSDVALDEQGVVLEVVVVRGGDLRGCESDLCTLLVDLTIARDTDDHELASAIQVSEGEDDVLERV